MSQSDAFEYNRFCDVCRRRLTTTDDMCETCEDTTEGEDHQTETGETE